MASTYDNGTDNQTGSDGDSKYKKGSIRSLYDGDRKPGTRLCDECQARKCAVYDIQQKISGDSQCHRYADGSWRNHSRWPWLVYGQRDEGALYSSKEERERHHAWLVVVILGRDILLRSLVVDILLGDAEFLLDTEFNSPWEARYASTNTNET